MQIINENVVFSKYTGRRNILYKIFEIDNENRVCLKNITYHREQITSISAKFTGLSIEVCIRLELFFIYYINQNKHSYSYMSSYDEVLTISLDEFKPKPKIMDVSNSNIIAYVRNLNVLYDINIDGIIITVCITGSLTVNIVKKRCIILNNNKNYNEDETIGQVAVSDENSSKDIKRCIKSIDNITSIIFEYVEKIENQNNYLKQEIERQCNNIENLNKDYTEERNKSELLSKECSRLNENINVEECRYIKEHKKVSILQIENNRIIEELKSIKKEKLSLEEKINKKSLSFKDKFKKLI